MLSKVKICKLDSGKYRVLVRNYLVLNEYDWLGVFVAQFLSACVVWLISIAIVNTFQNKLFSFVPLFGNGTGLLVQTMRFTRYKTVDSYEEASEIKDKFVN